DHRYELTELFGLARVVFRGPGAEFHNDRDEVQAFFGQRIYIAAFVGRVQGFSQNAFGFELFQPPREDIRCNAFVRPQKFTVSSLSPKRYIAHDQQRPRIAYRLKRKVYWAIRPVLLRVLPVHLHLESTTKIQAFQYHLQYASDCD